MTGFVYMMSDRPRGVIYIGVTGDLHGRVWEHRNEVHRGFTRKYRAKNLVWFELHPIDGLNPTWLDLYERIDEIENVYRPQPNTKMWSDYN